MSAKRLRIWLPIGLIFLAVVGNRVLVETRPEVEKESRAQVVPRVDVLRVESSGEGEEATTAVKAGKYVTEDVYVGVTQGATAEAGGVEVEIEVTPNISIETENRSDGQSNVGVRFKRDY